MEGEEEVASTVAVLRDGGSAEDLARARERLIHLHMEVACSVARRYRNRGISDEDLEQAALLALVKAARAYDPTKSDSFLSYAVPCIRGALKRHFRDRGWVVKPPRRVQELQYDINRAVEQLEQRDGRSPRPSEIAAHLRVPRSDVVEALMARSCYAPASLDAPVAGAAATGDLTVLDCVPAGEGGFGAAEARAVLAPSLRRLRPRDRRIVQLRFFEQRTQQEIADEIGVTQMQVSRLLRRIISELRDQLSAQTLDARAAV